MSIVAAMMLVRGSVCNNGLHTYFLFCHLCLMEKGKVNDHCQGDLSDDTSNYTWTNNSHVQVYTAINK